MRRSPSSLARLASIGLLAPLLAACVAGTSSSAPGGTSTPPGDSGSPAAMVPHPGGPADLVIRVSTVGGFVAPGARYTTYPTVSIYGDGSIVTVGPQIAIYPGPLLPNLLVRHISETGLQRLLGLARSSGLLELSGRFPSIGIADAPDTELTIVTDSRHSVSANALGEQSNDSQLEPAARSARAIIRQFVARVGDLPGTLGPSEVSAEQAFTPSGVRLFVGPPVQSDAGLPAQRPIPWPLSTPLASFGAPFSGLPGSERCGVVTGSDLAAVLPFLARANSLTPWQSASATFGLLAHPLLPDEQGCPAAS